MKSQNAMGGRVADAGRGRLVPAGSIAPADRDRHENIFPTHHITHQRRPLNSQPSPLNQLTAYFCYFPYFCYWGCQAGVQLSPAQKIHTMFPITHHASHQHA